MLRWQQILGKKKRNYKLLKKLLKNCQTLETIKLKQKPWTVQLFFLAGLSGNCEFVRVNDHSVLIEWSNTWQYELKTTEFNFLQADTHM
jgi:hypothetical protein